MINEEIPEIDVRIGDKVCVIVEVWREDENPTYKNFYRGNVTEIIKRATHSFYVRVSGLDRLIPIDRVAVV